MQKLEFKDGLLYTSISIVHEKKRVIVEDVIIDTGAFHTKIAPEFLDELDIGFNYG